MRTTPWAAMAAGPSFRATSLATKTQQPSCALDRRSSAADVRTNFRAAARRGDANGHAFLGLSRLRERRYRSALKSLRRATQQREGAPTGWAGLGYAHLYGAGVPQSDELAARSIWMAAKSGHLDSIYNMGVLTLRGKGVRQNVQSGFRFLSVAAEFSHPQAQLHVGHMIRLGLGVRKDCRTAQFFLKHAAEQGPLVKSLMSTALAAQAEKEVLRRKWTREGHFLRRACECAERKRSPVRKL